MAVWRPNKIKENPSMATSCGSSPSARTNGRASEITSMPHLVEIAIAPGLTFDALTAGKPGAPLVLLLHGFAESMHCWRAQVAALADAGYRAVAPGQRGYSPGARPDVSDSANYHIDRLMDDAMAIAAASGYATAAFTSSATTGAAASPGRLPIVFPSGWHRSPCCHGRIPTP